MLVHAPWARRYRTGTALVFGNQLRVEVGLPVAWDLQIELARVGDDRLAAVSVAAGARLLASEVVVHLGLQGALGERLLQDIEKAIRVKGRLGIGPSQELVQNASGIRGCLRLGMWELRKRCEAKQTWTSSVRVGDEIRISDNLRQGDRHAARRLQRGM